MSRREDEGHQPIEQQHRELMNGVAAGLSDIFPGLGFALLVFPLGENDGRMNYICNCEREDMLTAMKEFIARNEGRYARAGAA